MKSKDHRPKQSSPLKSSEFRWESPIRTPTTLTSFSFSSQELVISQPPSRGHTPLQTDRKAKEVKNFQGEYLEFGLWPDMSLLTQAELKAKYKAQKIRGMLAQAETQRLKSDLRTARCAPCTECEQERERHNTTKKALEDAVALSSVLLQQVLDMDERHKGKRSMGVGIKSGRACRPKE